jgi:hypothetical protein
MDSSTHQNTLYDPSTNNAPIADDTQAMLNTPLAGGSLDPEDHAFKEKILALIDAGTLNIYSPSTLINTPIYEALSPEAKVKAEQHSHSMMAKIRDVVRLHKADMDTNYQEKNLIHSLRLNKEQMEQISGDIFII